MAENPTHKYKFGLAFYINFALSVIFVLTAFILVDQITINERRQALIEADTKAQLILDRNLAIHTYFSHILKPTVFALTDSVRNEDYFEPAWMSSTFAVREIDKKFNSLNNEEFYYKECAINARSLENEADEFEKKFIEELNSNPELKYRSMVRKLRGQYFYVVLRRGEVMEKSCLRCHSTPDEAPKGLVDVYGPERSFNRSKDDVVSAISIRVPLTAAYARADQLAKKLSTILVIVLLFIYAVQYLVYRVVVLSPVSRLKDKALNISEDEALLGDEIELPASREFAELASAFNVMSHKLRHHLDHLEVKVEERTSELKTANEQLKNAFDEIKTLKGILPICASCKKIRDDKGYWNQIEAYIQTHSEAEFSHGICPECIKKLYPDEYEEMFGKKK